LTKTVNLLEYKHNLPCARFTGAQGFLCYYLFMKQTRSIIIIDGSNFYHKLRSLGLKNLFYFDYLGFSKSVCKNTRITKKYFCIGKIRAAQADKKAREMMAKQQSLVTRLQKQGFTIQFGYLLKSDNHYHEKGVDVQMATNLLVGAFRNQYDQAYLISSDSDLIPAISQVKKMGKKVIYVGFQHQPSLALLKNCQNSHLLDKSDLLFFVKK